MVETCVGPSELHLKKELTALRKARFLRDPETCSSWRSPLSSKSFSSTFGLNYQNGIHANSTVVNGPGELLEIPSRNGYRRKKVYLYNWRHHSGKSSDSGIQLDEEDQKLSVEGSPEDSVRNHHKFDYKSDTNLEVPVNIYSVRGTTQGSPVRRTSRKMKRSAISSKQRVIKRLEVSKLLDLPSSSLGDLDSVEQSDDTPYCNSEDLRQLTHEVTQKNGYVSHSASPFFSGSGRGNWQHSSKILRNTRQDGSSRSYTPASTNSYYRYGCRNPSTVGSWDDTATSFDGDDLDQLDLPGRQGCGIPCYWAKRTRGRGCGGSCSPSLSDILKRKGSSILCGSETIYNKKRPSSSHKQKYLPKSSQGLPLLTNSCDGGGSSVDTESDEQSTNIGEIELEASSRLDGRRWSSCKSQDGLELARSGGVDLEMPDHRSLSQKYRPRSFDDVIGQTIIVHSLSNAILRGRVAPAYLFHGPRGTGKTSTARIFAAALNCLSSEEKRPCGFCRECTHMSSGNGSHVREVDATDKKGIDRVRYMLKKMSVASTFIRYKVFVIDQCHMLSSKMWSAFMMFLEEAPPRVVFIFITIDPENLSRAILSRCQKYLFSKVKDVDIVSRLRKLSAEENLDVELDALDLIAVNSDGSLQDAETMLDQLSLLGKRITTSLVNDLVGVVSDEKLLDLLEIAMSSDTAETVKRSRELMDAGVDPMALMSQIAGLIMDIISGTYRLATSQCSGSVLAGRSLTEAELDKLQQALKILSDAEKQLRLSSERSTWFTAALLQLGSGHNKEPTQSSSSSKQSTKKKNDGVFDMAEGTSFSENKHHPLVASRESNLALSSTVTSGNPNPHDCTSQRIPTEILVSDVLPINSQSDVRSLLDATQIVDPTGKRVFRCVSPDKLVEIWKRCIQRCHSLTLRQLLSAHGKLLSISETEDVLIAFIAFENGDIKTRAERYLSSITNSLEIVLRHNVEIRLGLVPENSTNGQKPFSELPVSNHTEGGFFNEDSLNGSYDKERHKGVPNLPRQTVDCADGLLQGTLEKCESSLVEDKGFQTASFQMLSSEGINGAYGIIEKGDETSVLRTHTVAIDDQRLESTWLQAAEKNTSGLTNHSNTEKSLVLLQHNVNCQKHVGSSMALAISSKQWEDELNHELKALKYNATRGFHEKQIGGHVDPYVISPSLLHSNNFTANFDRENLGYESGPTSGCNGLFCWNTHKAHREKLKQGAHVKSHKTGRLSLFGQCGKSKAPSSRLRR